MTIDYNITFHDSGTTHYALTALNAAVLDGQFGAILTTHSGSYNPLVIQGQFNSTTPVTSNSPGKNH